MFITTLNLVLLKRLVVFNACEQKSAGLDFFAVGGSWRLQGWLQWRTYANSVFHAEPCAQKSLKGLIGAQGFEPEKLTDQAQF